MQGRKTVKFMHYFKSKRPVRPIVVASVPVSASHAGTQDRRFVVSLRPVVSSVGTSLSIGLLG